MKVRMRADPEWQPRSANIFHRRAQPQPIADFVIEIEHKRPRPERRELGIGAGIEPRRDEVRTLARNLERAIVGQAMNRAVMRGVVDGKPNVVPTVREAAVGNSSRPWKQNRNAGAKRMRLPVGLGILGARNHLDRSDAVAAALKARLGSDDCAFRLSLDSYEFHR